MLFTPSERCLSPFFTTIFKYILALALHFNQNNKKKLLPLQFMSDDDHTPEMQCITESLELAAYPTMQVYMAVLPLVRPV